MKRKSTLVLLTLAATLPAAYCANTFEALRALYQRTDGLNVGGDDFTGALPARDGSGTLSPFIDVDAEPGNAPIDLTGDNHDIAFLFEFFDADGSFSFTENYDDRVQITVTPIAGPLDLTATGPAGPTHSDVGWNVRTYADYNFGSGGWFSAQVYFTEDGGGAQSAGGIGFGYRNGPNTGVDTDFGGIGYASANGQAVFDVDPVTGLSWGATIVPEPSSSVILALGGALLFFRRRR